LGCAVEGFSSSHHGGSHRTDNYVMHGPWTTFLKWKNGEIEKGSARTELEAYFGAE
jgi:hypothetical protein